MKMSRLIGCLSLALAMGAMSASSYAQAPGGDGGGGAGAAGDNGGGGGRRGGGGFSGRDMTQWRNAMNERLKADMGASDDEYKALQPKIEKIQQLQRDLSSSRYRGFGGRGMGGPGGPGSGQGGAQPGGQPAGQPGATPAAGDAAATPPTSPVVAATRELTTLLENKDAKPEEIKAKLDAVRAAKVKAHEELAKAQAELKELLSQRQEAVLVNNGTLE